MHAHVPMTAALDSVRHTVPRIAAVVTCPWYDIFYLHRSRCVKFRYTALVTHALYLQLQLRAYARNY